MKILIVCNKFPYPLKDGGAIATFAMITGFAQAGHAVTVAAINTKKHHFDIEKLPQELRSVADFYALDVDTSITVAGTMQNLLFSAKPYTATRFHTAQFADLLIDLLKKQNFDIIQIEGLYMCEYIEILRKNCHSLISYRAHNVEYEIWERLYKESSNPLKRLYVKNLAARVKRYEYAQINRYDFLVPITTRDAEQYTVMGNKKTVCVTPTGFDAERIEALPSQERAVSVFHLGSLEWLPNQQGLLWFLQECWGGLHAEFPHIVLRIAGRNAPQHFIDTLKHYAGVEFCGEVPSARGFMAENTIMIVPLLSGSGMRIKIVEGLAYAKAIVSTPVGAEGIDAEQFGAICIAHSAEEFTAALRNLLLNDTQRKELERNAINFVRTHFENSLLVQKLLEFYENHIH
ncbi:MAG: glycosyltransferase family 4 protein [Bacteroidales bacterium]|jgi:glycosyltransferase involved in cell wall biosynthesis|nr:glycosyltransferase family 4 protein [Bacteroidales bacterium]